tara:strand:- start:40 stop:537 length:498 start_codon:yes stop_codon:yes gene_type:complete
MDLGVILIIDNFLTPEECKTLIKIYGQNQGLATQWPLHTTGPCAHVISTTAIFNPLLKRTLSRTQEMVRQYFNPKISIDWAKLKKHDKGASHPFHFDLAKDNTVLFSVIYLNTLSSGYTIFKDKTQVSPEAGRLLLFDGQKYFHGVSQTQEDRYTVSTWYKISSI